MRSTYQRIILQSLLFAHSIPPYNYQHWTPQVPELSRVFHSLTEARDDLYQLLALVRDFCKLACTNSQPSKNHLGTPIVSPDEQKYLISKLGEWRDAFNLWCADNDLKDARTIQSISLLRLYDHVSVAWLTNPWEVSQLPFDTATEYFRLVVEEASAVLVMVGSKYDPSSCFHFEKGVMPPLYFTAIKCRYYELRQHALSLLRQAPRREGLWDREELIALAERVIGLETAAAYPEGLIPDAGRVCDVSMVQQDKGSL